MHHEKRKGKEKEKNTVTTGSGTINARDWRGKGTYEAFVPFVAMGTWLDNLVQLVFFWEEEGEV